ncbi:MAG: N-acetylmuramoyl-L-alanine amidase family protein, partial [Streptococcus sanguinis]|nr:N-acetylmuramoyl-L-alanine amidase family protein [Streptococcus sanguinis]
FDSQYDSWYYLNQDGKYARNQWIKDGDKWYYLLADGKLAKNMTVNGYKVNEKGEWV